MSWLAKDIKSRGAGKDVTVEFIQKLDLSERKESRFVERTITMDAGDRQKATQSPATKQIQWMGAIFQHNLFVKELYRSTKGKGRLVHVETPKSSKTELLPSAEANGLSRFKNWQRRLVRSAQRERWKRGWNVHGR